MKKRITLRDIAKAVGFSLSTVFLATRNDDRALRISTPTRNRILNEAKRLGYRPDAFTRLVYGRKTHLIGIMMGNVAHSFTDIYRHALVDRLKQNEIQALVSYRYWEMGQQERSPMLWYLHDMIETVVDGLIIIEGFAKEEIKDMIKIIEDLKIPVVIMTCNKEAQEGFHKICPVTSTHHSRGGYLAGKHLCELGHRCLATFFPSDHPSSIAKLRGFRDAVAEYPDAMIKTIQPSDTVSTYPEPMFIPQDVTAIFCQNDLMCQTIFRLLKRTGRAVPEDVSVVGFDDQPIASLCDPPLTTVAEPVAEVADRIVALLLDGLEKKDHPEGLHLFEPRLVTRSSTASPHIQG